MKKINEVICKASQKMLFNKTASNFTTKTGAKIRQFLHPLMRVIVAKNGVKKFVIDNQPNFEKNTKYLILSTHGVADDIVAGIAIPKKHPYLLVGTTEQFLYNPKLFLLWVSGGIYMNKHNEESRKSVIPKALKAFEYGSDVWMCPEGVHNNLPHKMAEELFPGFYYIFKEAKEKLKKDEKIKIIIMSPYTNPNLESCHIKFSEAFDPLELYANRENAKFEWSKDTSDLSEREFTMKLTEYEMSKLYYAHVLDHEQIQEVSESVKNDNCRINETGEIENYKNHKNKLLNDFYENRIYEYVVNGVWNSYGEIINTETKGYVPSTYATDKNDIENLTNMIVKLITKNNSNITDDLVNQWKQYFEDYVRNTPLTYVNELILNIATGNTDYKSLVKYRDEFHEYVRENFDEIYARYHKK